MPHPLRWYLPGVTYETTIRTLESRFLLRPDDDSREIVHSVMARALRLYPAVRLHNYDTQSNHLHVELSSIDGQSIPRFLRYVHGNLAREIGRLRGWAGPFWSRRARVIPIVDDEAIVQRFRYILAQGVAAGLVASPREWPGASAASALTSSMRIAARWISRRRHLANARRVRPAPVETLAESVEVMLSAIPPWAGLSHDELIARHAALVEDIERECGGRTVVGVTRLETTDPRARPANTDTSPAPACHASSPRSRARFAGVFRVFCDAYAVAAAQVRDMARRGVALTKVGLAAIPFPFGSCPLVSWYAEPPAPHGFWPPWTEPIALSA